MRTRFSGIAGTSHNLACANAVTLQTRVLRQACAGGIKSEAVLFFD